MALIELINPNLQAGWPLDQMNPGLAKEVSAHEDGHRDQFEEAFKSDLTVSSGFANVKDGKKSEITYSGKIDQILNKADEEFDVLKKQNPDLVKKYNQRKLC